MDKVKMQDAQLMQASGVTTSTDDDQSTVMGTTSATKGSNSQGTVSQGANRPSQQGLEIYKGGTICMLGSSSIHVHQLICLVIDSMCATCTE